MRLRRNRPTNCQSPFRETIRVESAIWLLVDLSKSRSRLLGMRAAILRVLVGDAIMLSKRAADLFRIEKVALRPFARGGAIASDGIHWCRNTPAFRAIVNAPGMVLDIQRSKFSMSLARQSTRLKSILVNLRKVRSLAKQSLIRQGRKLRNRLVPIPVCYGSH